MGRKRKKSAYPDEWEVVDETEDFDATSPTSNTETLDPNATPPTFDTVAETQDSQATPIKTEEVPHDAVPQLGRGSRHPGSAPQKRAAKMVTAKGKRRQIRVERPKRRKSMATYEEDLFKKGKSYFSVMCRLGSICHDLRLCEEIQRTARDMKQIQLEAWHLVNLHTLRCLENELALPDYADDVFFYHCCSGVSTTRMTYHIAQKNPELWKSTKLYQSHRERAGLVEVANRVGYAELKREMRRQMVVNAGVMIRENFRQRLRLYVRLVFVENSTLSKKKKKKKVNAIVRACYSVGDTELVEARTMRELLTPEGVTEWSEQWIPWPDHIQENGMAFYVRLLWKFQAVVEKRSEAEPNEKGVRTFTLFPVSSSFITAHITINGSTLAGFYSRMSNYEFGLPYIPVTSAFFQGDRWEVMRHAFDIARFETRIDDECPKPVFALLSVEEKYEHASHLFANQVTTDGYSASVLLTRAKTEEEKADKKKASEGPIVPAGLVPDVAIGIDPGMRALVTAVREDFRPGRRRRRRRQRPGRRRRRRGRGQARRKSNRPRWIRRPKPPKHRNDRDIVQVTTREYRHLAGFNRFRSWNKGLRKRNPEYQAVIAGMPSFTTAVYKTYLERLQYFWRNAAFLLQFSVDRPFLKYKFFRKRMARVAVDTIARRIVPDVSARTLVAYGDWSRRRGIKGHAPSPVKGLKEALRKRATVVSMDEFRTSKLCSQCHHALSPVRYVVDTMLQKRRKRKGFVVARNRAEIQLENKKCHGVLRCDHASCTARYWDRDVNAAINMLELLKSEVLGRGRMEQFRRS